MPNEETSDVVADPNIESVLSAIRAFAGSKEFARVVQLEERCRLQREVITRLEKEAKGLRESTRHYDKRPSWIADVKDGMSVKDTFGRELTIKSFGASGFIDQDGKERLWYIFADAELLWDGPK